ncbi:MAG: polyphosphate polymerase domain-containing protein [Bacilli bacterium]|nr:polyphosphate polymerase domain-containing protein [Bacilli bacterium]
MRKYRYELKYIISSSMAEILKNKLLTIMEIDQFAKSENGEYTISSLYFDDLESTAYFEKLDGVRFRTKYRIRVYDYDDSFIRLERKLKHENMTSKDQTKISKEIFYKIINNEIEEFVDTESGLYNEFVKDIRLKQLRPSVIVEYKRTALTYPISDVRVTFDSKVRSGMYNYDLFDPNLTTFSVLKPNEVILEVKFNDYLPQHISLILSTIPAFRKAVSKFALCRAIK